MTETDLLEQTMTVNPNPWMPRVCMFGSFALVHGPKPLQMSLCTWFEQNVYYRTVLTQPQAVLGWCSIFRTHPPLPIEHSYGCEYISLWGAKISSQTCIWFIIAELRDVIHISGPPKVAWRYLSFRRRMTEDYGERSFAKNDCTERYLRIDMFLLSCLNAACLL